MHETMVDECKPIVLEGGVRVDFPPPTKTVQRLRRLRTRCGSRGRGVSASSLGGIPGMQAHQAEDAPGTPAGSCVLLPGLSCAPDVTGQETYAILASPLLAGLRRAEAAEAPAETPSQQQVLEALREISATAVASPSKKTAWADLEDDECSECSTHAPGYCSSALSSDGSDGRVAKPRSSVGSAQSWPVSMLAGGLMPALPEDKGARPGSLIEVVGTYPSGTHAVVTAVDREEGTYQIQLMHSGCRTGRSRTIKCKHARLLRHAE
ncbi:unnamed protein product [Prorocentrum cordatum]|uniref:Uncharacterized protein n=1 Tax=Prorocentrum cordatum TaxID=2364126 RepID=A0ABN9X035_9DINO|nr:unnamed protein product [Polarella glacialis]